MRLHAPPIAQFASLTNTQQPTTIDELFDTSHWTKEETALASDNIGSPHAVIIGSPGIGKSFALFWLLRVLLQRGEHVVFHSSSPHSVYQFVPPRLDDGLSEHVDAEGRPIYRAFRCCSRDFRPMSCAALANPQAFYLFDPEVDKGQASMVAAHTVTAAPPNPTHFSEREKHGDEWYFMSPWRLDELLGAGRELSRGIFHGEEPTDEYIEQKVRKAFHLRGGSLRFTFRSDFWSCIRSSQDSTIAYTRMDSENDLHILFARFGVIVDGELETETQWNSYLYSYHSSFPFTLKTRWREFASHRTSHELALRHREKCLRHVRSLLMSTKEQRNFLEDVEDDVALAAIAFEALGLALLIRGGSFDTYALVSPLQRAQQPRSQSKEKSPMINLELSKVDEKDVHRICCHTEDLATLCATLSSVEEQRRSHEDNEGNDENDYDSDHEDEGGNNNNFTPLRVLFAISSDERIEQGSKTGSFVDCVDAKDRGFHFTVTERQQSINVSDACAFLRKVGAIRERPFHRYIVVPSEEFAKSLFLTMPGIIEVSEDDRNLPRTCLVHHLLVIETHNVKELSFAEWMSGEY